MAGVILRIVSSRAPYRRAGVSFDPTGHKTIVATLVALDELDEARLTQLLADPHLDVTAGNGLFFGPVETAAEVLDLAEMLAPPAEQPEPARGTEDILAEHARMEAEQARDAAAPGGDDEFADGGAPDFDSHADAKAAGTAEEPPAATQNTAADPVADAAPPEAAAGEKADDTTAADAPGASAATPPAPKRGGKK